MGKSIGMIKSIREVCRRRKFLVAVCLALSIVSGSISFWLIHHGDASDALVFATAEPSSNVTVYYFDVGQGDSIFIDTSDKDVLIDGGPASAVVTTLDYLYSLSITRIHLMIATHVHEDHIGGLIAVLDSAMIVDEILINNQTHTTSTYTNFMNLAQDHTIIVAQRGQTFVLTETVNLTVLNPIQPLEFSSKNDNSIVVKLHAGNTSFLFTGDAEEDAEESMVAAGLYIQSDILKVGHHGSLTATKQEFLDGVAPSHAVISAGEDNKYGHPHEETIDRLLAKGVIIYGTFQSGTIVASTDGSSIVFLGDPEPVPEFHSSILLPLLIMATLLVLLVSIKGKAAADSDSVGMHHRDSITYLWR